MNPDTDYVVLEVQPIRHMGGSYYFYLPHKWREKYKPKLMFSYPDIGCPLEIHFLQAPGSEDIVMRIVEIPKQGE